MFEELKERILGFVEYPEDQITENTEFVKDLQMTSLDIMVMLGDLEVEYNITFDTEEIQDVLTIGEFLKLLDKKLNK